MLGFWLSVVFRKCLTMNCVINVIGITLLTFYIFRCLRMYEDYRKLCRLGTCMTMKKMIGRQITSSTSG
jgi:hypothetical protein